MRTRRPSRHPSRDPPFWYSITLVSEKFFSFVWSIISVIPGNGFSAGPNTGFNPSCAHRRFVMNRMYCSHSSALRPSSPRGIVSRP